MKLETINLKRISLRKELRFALLAAMETCWVFTVVVFLSALTKPLQPLTPLPFFIAYWLALAIGRILPGTQRAWIVLQIAAVAIAFITVAAVARAEIYPTLNWYDVTWLPRLASGLLSITHGFAVEHIVSAGVLYVFIRGLGFAQRPLTLWFIGFQFRLGIVVFFGLLLMAAFFKNVVDDQLFGLWVFIYFFVSLISIALARMEEMGSDLKYSARWALTLLAAVAFVLFLGLGVLQIFTLDTAQAILLLFAPVWWVISLVLVVLAIPFGYLLEWLMGFLRPLFEGLGQIVQALQNSPLGSLMKDLQQNQNAPIDATLLTIIKTIAVSIVVLGIVYWLAHALNRRMNQIEDEQYVRESIGDDEDAQDRARRASTKKKSALRSPARNLSAETIRRIYAALVARAAAAGVTRQVAETPYEFLPRLEQYWLDASADLRAITEAYVQVHYAEYQTPTDQVGRIRAAWRRIEEMLKRKT